MKTLTFEQIGCGNSRFRLEQNEYIFEINYHRPYRFWMLTCYSNRIRSNIKLEKKDFSKIKDAVNTVGEFFDHEYTIKIGANEYPKHFSQVKQFCQEEQLEFDFTEVKTTPNKILKYPNCECGNKTGEYGGHLTYCQEHPSKK